MSRLWDKGKPLDELVLRYTVGDDHLLDARLVAYDVRASIAHADMLARQGYLEAADRDALADALRDLAASHAAGEWAISLQEEDCHTALEGRLVERLGDAGKRIHLGRSRNDQVMAALRLYLRDAVEELAGLAEDVAAALQAMIERQGELALPGYTHLQRAMPSSVAWWAGGFRSELLDDAAGMRSCRRRIDRNPLGSAAGYGTPGLQLDRVHTAEALGFAGVHEPVTAVQLSRGKAEAQVLFEVVMLMQDLGRLAADLCLFATAEFAFVRLPDRFTTGSSIMPQKRNPDLFELIRGRSATAAGDLQAALGLTAKMPSGYHRDLQLVKAPLFRGLDSAGETCQVMTHALAGVEFDPAACAAAMDPTLDATEEAYRLVTEQGMSFREAYRAVAEKLRG